MRTVVRVTEVERAEGYKLTLRFTDGTSGTVDLEPTLRRIGPLRALLSPERFAEVRVAHGTICWPGDLDLAPETLYAMARGER